MTASSARSKFRSQVEFIGKMPGPKRLAGFFDAAPERFLLIYDKRLLARPGFKTWVREFRFSYGVKGGEKLKDLDYLPGHLKAIFKIMGAVSPQNMCIVAAGGGTLGDFGGFVASIFKRGVPLIHIPTTLLAGIDSAHGGKTALNLGDFKNQVGSFHPAQAVLLVRELFEGLPTLQIKSGIGELFKMALIGGGELYDRVRTEVYQDLESFWSLMPLAIEAKYRIVEKDPFETLGERQVLNLGHSLGHVLESHYGLAHGVAVSLGLEFALNWSEHRGYLKADKLQEILDALHGPAQMQSAAEFFKSQKKMSRSRLLKLVTQDKKMKDSTHLNFVFLENVGSVFRRSVSLDSFLTEAERQGWVY